MLRILLGLVCVLKAVHAIDCPDEICVTENCKNFPNAIPKAHAVNENCTCYFEVDGKKIESFLCDIEHVCTADNPIYPCEYPLPCQEQKCAKYPAAKCYNYVCGTCRADFFVGNVNRTAECG
ncbi:uncharacterized protein [Mytilus edulis]|uniref:uncharacterized protein n=1 Tax=Mytilus edulis TaxID=6550 RepID=UPI0039F14860